MNLQNLAHKLKRLGKVIYWFVLLINSLTAVTVLFFEESPYQPNEWLTYTTPSLYLLSGLWFVGIFLTLEIVRRIISYISDETPIFKKYLPFGVKYYLYLSLVLVILGGLFYLIQPKLESYYKKSEAKKQLVIFDNFLDNYSSELIKARECSTNGKDKYYEVQKPICDANYRRVKLAYDACREYGSRTMCLSYNDYESVDCSKDTLTKNFVSYSCDMTKIDAEPILNNYLSYYKLLDMSERVRIYEKMANVAIKQSPDSMFTSYLVDKSNARYFKDEADLLIKAKQE